MLQRGGMNYFESPQCWPNTTNRKIQVKCLNGKFLEYYMQTTHFAKQTTSLGIGKSSHQRLSPHIILITILVLQNFKMILGFEHTIHPGSCW